MFFYGPEFTSRKIVMIPSGFITDGRRTFLLFFFKLLGNFVNCVLVTQRGVFDPEEFSTQSEGGSSPVP